MNTARRLAGVLSVALTTSSCVYASGFAATQPTVPPTQINSVRPASPVPSATSTTPDTTPAQSHDTATIPLEEIAVRQAAHEVCFDDLGNPYVSYDPDFYAVDSSYRFRCDLATGHTTSAYIEQFASRVEAQASFLATVEGHVIQDFHGYPFAAWETEFYISDFGGKTRIANLQVERWVIGAQSDDDTHFLIAPDPADVVEDIYRRMVDLGMISSSESG